MTNNNPFTIDWEDRARTTRLWGYVIEWPLPTEAEIDRAFPVDHDAQQTLTEAYNADPIEEADDDPYDDSSVEPDRSLGLPLDRARAVAWLAADDRRLGR